MDPEEEKKKKLNDDVVVFLRKRSETETPRYAARLHAYVDLQRKRSRVAAAKRRSEHGHERKISANRKKGELEQKDKDPEAAEHAGPEDDRMSRRRGGGEKSVVRNRSFSRSRSVEPSDRCGRRRRKKRSCSRRHRRRRRSRRRRRRRRRSCGRRRRRRRSCSRRRRRRSCRRRRRCRRRGCR